MTGTRLISIQYSSSITTQLYEFPKYAMCMYSVTVLYHILSDYWTAYTQQPYYPRLYPYSDNFGDETVKPGVDTALSFALPYSGKHFHGVYVSGTISCPL